MLDAVQVSKRSMLQKVLNTFIITLLIATAGLYIGQFVPAALMIPLAIAEVIMIIAAFWLRRRKAVGYTFVFVFAFISGITTFPIVSHYASVAGAQVVLMAFGTTFCIFTVMGFIGAKTKKDLSFLASFLLVAVLAMIFVGIFSIFSPLNSAALLGFSVIGTIVFSLYIIYDFNQMKHRGITEDMIPLLALSLYLDFINLFINILRFFGIISSND
ncbi:Bax inhibitor-1/YccA family protein [Metabacillus fastidiosus]|uniref:Bax inhibitor-1/YccA family protein n=1 Tax=Metabacillus fastidiosus TaxID=1458 RepID=UPI002DB55CD9|nr:Bax inhibitor-1/YccA family protein [Metabacillus fastidiosus]MEC2075142.1 Bax inhibitor-1/YccA family protein [Metabacillus fastidiosus]